MNTSPSKPSDPSSVEARRTALRTFFWRNRIMQKFRDGQGSVFRLPQKTPASTKLLMDYAMGEGPFNANVEYHEFQFIGHHYGHELYLAVTCEGLVIVPPFPFPAGSDRGLIPFFREEM